MAGSVSSDFDGHCEAPPRRVQIGDQGAEDTGVPFSDLLTAMRDERAALEEVEFALYLQYLANAGEPTRWAGRINEAVTEAVAAAGVIGDRLGRAAAAAGQALELPAGSTLAQIAAGAPAGWTERLGEQRGLLREQVGQVQAASQRNRGLLASRLTATRDAMESLTQQGVAYARSGEVGRPRVGGLVLDSAL